MRLRLRNGGYLMEEYKQDEPKRETDPSDSPKEPPSLPNDFFIQLLHLPACKSTGHCDHCGRCER